FALFKAAGDRFFWYARYHHIVMDGYGMYLMARRLAEVYTELRIGHAPSDVGPFCSLAVLLEEDVAYRASEQFKWDRQYWSNCLADRPEPLNLGGRQSVGPNGFVRHSACLTRSTVDQLCSIAQHVGANLSHIIMAATAIFLHRLTGAEDLIFGLAVD